MNYIPRLSIRQAYTAARSGKTHWAFTAFESFASKGDGRAAAALQQLYSFTNEWSKSIEYGIRAIRNPQIWGGIPFESTCRLLIEGGKRTDYWEWLAPLADELYNGIRAARFETKNEDHFVHLVREILLKRCSFVHESIVRKGTEAERKDKEEQVRAGMLKAYPDMLPREIAQLEARCAYRISDDALMVVWKQHERLLEFQAAYNVMRIHYDRGEIEQAWQVIKSRIHLWRSPVLWDVVPYPLFAFRELMTPERCAEVLAINRRSESDPPLPGEDDAKPAASTPTKKKPVKRTSEWGKLLTAFSKLLLQDPEVAESLDEDVAASKWLGSDGASETDIAALEKRIGKTLPPSYRSFLAESDGWRQVGTQIGSLLPAAQVAWLREQHQSDIIDPWVQSDSAPTPDKQYFVYGKKQDPAYLRPQYLPDCLQISEVTDGAVLLLNPQVVTGEGEWEAWLLASWLPGAERYRSFKEMMTALRDDLKARLKTD